MTKKGWWLVAAAVFAIFASIGPSKETRERTKVTDEQLTEIKTYCYENPNAFSCR